MSTPQGSRFSEYNPSDHQAPLWIATSITLAYTGLLLLVRLAIKIKLLALDDLFLAVAHIVGIAQWGIMYASLNDGVGRKVFGIEQSNAAKLVSVSRILTILTVGFTKGSVILFLRQVFAGTAKKGYNLCTAPMVATGVWTLASTMTVSINCAPSSALLLDKNPQCPGDLARWKVVAAVDVCLEIMLVVIPAILFYSVKISKVRKATIIVAFLPRILVPAIFITYLEAYIRFRKYGGSSIEAVGTLVWQQVLCGYSLVSATTPCLKGFLGRFHTEGIAGTLESSYGNRAYGQNSTTRTNPDVYALESLDRKNSTKRPPKTEPVSLACYPGEAIHSATAYGGPLGDHSASSVKSFGSERMMIHRKIEYDVTST